MLLDFVCQKTFFLIQIQSGHNEVGYQEFEYTGVQYLDASAIQWK